ncbi:MAG: magnesium transporter CorA family protein [Enterococcus sp.]
MEQTWKFHRGEALWVNIEYQNASVIDELQKKYHLDDEILAYTLDKDERARVEYDAITATFLLVFNVPHQLQAASHYDTSPITFVVKENYLFSFVSQQTAYVSQLMAVILKQNPDLSIYELLFKVLFRIADGYFPLIEEVNSQWTKLNQRLRKKATNQNLLELADLEIDLVYLVTATKQNAILLQQMKALTIFRALTPSEQEQLDDALIEAQQAVEMTQLAAQVMEQLSSAYNNVLNNNLNDTMKFLTVWSLLLTIPTLVTGFFGMNLPLPFADSILGWGVAVILSLLLAIWMILLLWRRIR